MKKYVRVQCAIAAALMVFSTVALASCKDSVKEPVNTTTQQSTNAQYTVNVVDSMGNPYKDAIVNIMQNGTLVSMLPAGNGLAVFDLKRDNYTVELGFYDSSVSFYYDAGECALTKDKTETTVKLYNKPTVFEEIYAFDSKADDHRAYKAFAIKEGASYVELTANERTYFLLAPEKGGVYKFGCTASGKALTVGYYGGTYNVLRDNAAKRDGDFVMLEFHQSMVGGVLVLGVDSADAANGIITIERTGDYEGGAEYKPWTSVTEENPIDFYENAVNRTYEGFEYLDLKDENLKVVLNSSDGYYHLGTVDGPVVYITLDRQTKYLQMSFDEICHLQNFGAYFYDEDGNFIKKESYTELFAQYSFGTVPLTEKLAYAIKTAGEYKRLWDFDWEGNIFADDAAFIVQENAWLFACGTFSGYQDIPNIGTADNPIKLSDEDDESTKLYIKDSAIYAQIDKTASRVLTVGGINSGVKVIYNGTEYQTQGSALVIELVSNVKSIEIVPDASNEGDYITLQVSVKQS